MLWLPATSSLASISPIAKIPLLLGAIKAAQLGSTPPKATAAVKYSEDAGLLRKSYTVPVSKLNRVRAIFVSFLGYETDRVSQVLIYLNAALESSLILVPRYPDYFPSALVGLVQRDTNASAIRLTPLWLAGWGLIILGGAIRVACLHTLGVFFTWDLTIKERHKLITTGPYAIVRHPGYVGGTLLNMGNVLVLFGTGGWFESLGGWDSPLGKLFAVTNSALFMAIPIMLCARVNQEDRFMRREFGEEWDAYVRRTPYRLIPFVY